MKRTNAFFLSKTSRIIYFLSFLFVLSVNSISAQIVVELKLPDPCNFSGVEETQDLKSFDFEIMPNPNSGSFSIDISSSEILGKIKIEVLDIKGEICYSEKVFSNSNKYTQSLKLKELSAGLYFVKLKGSKSSAIKKLIIK